MGIAVLIALITVPAGEAQQAGAAGTELPGDTPTRHWLFRGDAGAAWSSYFGEGWRDALAERANDDPAVPDSETNSGFHLGLTFGFLAETDITPVSPPYAAAPRQGTEQTDAAASQARFFPDALRLATGLAWQRLGGEYRYSESDRSGTQTIARNYLTIPLEVAMRGRLFDWPLGYAVALGPALMVPVGGVLVRTELDGDTSESIYEGDAFRTLVPGGTARLGLDYPLGPGRLGLSVRGGVTISDIEAGSGVWLWGFSPRLSYSLSARAIAGLFSP
jgi:hypothetical protein